MSADLMQRLRNHIAQMAPHQREREQGRLIVDALAEIERLSLTSTNPEGELQTLLKALDVTLVAANGIVWIERGFKPVCFGSKPETKRSEECLICRNCGGDKDLCASRRCWGFVNGNVMARQ